MAAKVLGAAVLDEALGLVWSKVTMKDLSNAALGIEETDGLIDDLRIAREADVALLLKETPEGWKGSLRSRGRVEIGRAHV